MDLDTTSKLQIFKKYGLPVLMISFILFLCAYYVYKEDVLRMLSQKYLSAAPSNSSVSSPLVSKSTKSLFIDIEGAVERPGVYEMKEGERINDAILRAGGFTADVDLDFVHKTINKAQKLTEGSKLYIPKVADSLQAESLTAESQENKLININSATKSDIDTLPGVGSVTVDKIISGRPYADVNELLSKKVLNSSQFEKVKDLITV